MCFKARFGEPFSKQWFSVGLNQHRINETAGFGLHFQYR